MDKLPKEFILPVSIIIAGFVIASAWVYTANLKVKIQKEENNSLNQDKGLLNLEAEILPSDGVLLPIVWGDLGKKLIDSGTIEEKKLLALYEGRGGFTEESKNLLLGENNGKVKITKENSGYLLNLFWALGLANKNDILEKGEMMDPQYGGAGNFASTGGWTLSKGNSMNHYSQHILIKLTLEQQALVDKISRGIYRPCCGNSTHFPDCNHGMAMLGLLELMASQGISEQDMWKTALVVNSFWFPDTYITIATFMQSQGIDWKNINAQEILGINYSSAQGYKNIAAQVEQPQQQKGGCRI